VNKSTQSRQANIKRTADYKRVIFVRGRYKGPADSLPYISLFCLASADVVLNLPSDTKAKMGEPPVELQYSKLKYSAMLMPGPEDFISNGISELDCKVLTTAMKNRRRDPRATGRSTPGRPRQIILSLSHFPRDPFCHTSLTIKGLRHVSRYFPATARHCAARHNMGAKELAGFRVSGWALPNMSGASRTEGCPYRPFPRLFPVGPAQEG